MSSPLSQPSAPCEPVKSATTLPLADAAQRLRRRPGRPRMRPRDGYVPGTSAVQPPDLPGSLAGPQDRLSSASSLQARLLTLQQAADYLNLSPWTVRELEAAGTIRRVRLPVRRLLFDRTALDKLIAS